MRKIASVILMLCIVHLVSAQDLHIYYDVYADSISYRRGGQIVQRPNLRKGSRAILHIVNYNDYIYDLQVTTTSENYEIPSAGTGKAFGLGDAGSAFQQIGDAAGNFGSSGFDLGANSLTSERDGAVEYESNISLQAIQLSKKFETALEEMADIESEIQELGEDIEISIENQRFAAFKKGELQRLRTNTSLPANTIKAISLDFMEQLLDVKEGRPVDINDLLEKSDPQSNIKASIEDYKIETSKLDRKFTELSAIAELLFAFELPATDEVSFQSAFSEAEKRSTAYQEKTSKMEEQMKKIQSWEMQDLADIYYLYEEMKDHRFEKRILLRPEDDMTNIKISLVPIDSVAVQGVRTKELSPVAIETFGGLKINASVGISFAGFFNRMQDYLVREGRIVGDDLDAFTPVITSFIHFHPQSKRQVSLGGAFGIGIGLGGEGGLQNYFLGPSLIIGKRQRIVFTTGLMTGKLDRLAEGYRVGDLYDQNIVPTKSIYELGYFLGISFNFLGQ